ncbi:MAG: hypothetical protein GX244_10740, partial [Firmicutes bacterium]|nr:hypothetical protein [Bacillota bacterium]
RDELLRWVGKFKQGPSQIILVHGENQALENMAELLRTNFHANVYIPSYLEELALLPLGKQLEPLEELSARLKAQQIIKMWEDSASHFKSLLLSYLEEETDLASLLFLEERLASITRQLEEEAGNMKSLPLLFGPLQKEKEEPEEEAG